MLLMVGVFTLLIAFKPSDFMEAYRATEVHALALGSFTGSHLPGR